MTHEHNTHRDEPPTCQGGLSSKIQDLRKGEVQGRDRAALLNPRPVALVGAYRNDTANFATVAWITPVSHEPALVAFALRARSLTLEMLKETQRCSINLIDQSLADLALWCGNHSGHTEDKDAFVPHELSPLPATTKTLPFITGALSVLTCSVKSIQEAGDHLLVIVSLEKAYTRCPRDDRGRISPLDTLLCVQHDTFTQAGEAALPQKHNAPPLFE
ncbi:MAG: flavin reductase family protein [Raoultibacter sp.]